MRKILPLILIFSFLLVSCNLPSPQPTLDPNVVASRVAETLAALPTNMAATLPAPTTEQPQPTVEPATPTPTETPTATPTATTSPTDPKLTLGEPSFSDTFNSYTAFFRPADYPFEDDAVIIKVDNGAMVFKSLRINGGKRWRLTSRNPQNQYLEGTFKTVSCVGYDQYGLVLRAPTYGDGFGYYFGVTCNGMYYFQRWNSSGTSDVLDLTPDSHILSGSGQVNRIGVMATNDSFKLYINGALVKELSDSGISEKGYIGAFVSAKEDPGFTVQMEEISSWTLP